MKREFKVNNFDVIRIFAAVQVMILHVLMHLKLDYPAWFLLFKPFSGVPMFFVISGFLISASYERNSDLKNYFKNRALRIYPGLWCCIFLTIFTIILFGGINFFRKETIPWLLSQMAGLIYTPGFLKSYGLGAYHVSLWTIPIELQFYVILPIFYLLFALRAIKREVINNGFLILFSVFLILSYILYTQKFVLVPQLEQEETLTQKVLRYSFIPHFYMFLFGVLLQRWNLYQSSLLYGKGLWWCLLFLLFTYIVPQSEIKRVFSMLLLCITTISLAYTKPGFAKKILNENDISYGVYIYHGLVINIFIVTGLTGKYVFSILVCLITIILAFMSWRIVERPFIRKKKVTLKEAT